MPHFHAEFPVLQRDSVLADWVDLAEQIAVCVRLLRATISRLAGRRQLTEAQLSVLWVCNRYTINGVHQADLAATLAISSAHVSGLVEQLRSRGLLVGCRAAPDRRCQIWRLTETGTACLASVLADLGDRGQGLGQPIASQDRQTFVRLLGRLLEAFQSEPVRDVAGRGRFPRLKPLGNGDSEEDLPADPRERESGPSRRYGGAAA
jgi:DNA-binding MarR family transcriptional regulator